MPSRLSQESVHQIDDSFFLRLYIELGLKEKENRRLSTLSGGENQSLKLVCALSQNVPMYFLDEPSQFLDSFRKEVLSNFLLSLRNSKKSVLIIEHDLSWLSGGWKVLGLEINEEKIKVGKTWTI
jgi:ABC-type Mn2+/Zn2+ transport system ATPase subunit